MTKKGITGLLISAAILSAALLSYFRFDRALAWYFHNLHDNALEDFVNSLSRWGESQWYILPSLLLWLWFRRRRQTRYAKEALFVLLANIYAGIAVWILKIPFGRLRPKMLFEHHQYGFEGWGIHYAHVSFPSGHSITAFATATALALLFPRFRVLFFLFAALVAFSRVTRGAHYLSDVLVGSWLGVLVALFLYRRMFGAAHA